MLTLLIALFLPWAAGSALWLCVPGQDRGPGSVLCALGFGLFLALAGVAAGLWVQDRLGAGLGIGPLLLLSGVVLGGALWRLRASEALPGALPALGRERPVAQWVLVGLLLLGIGLHFTFSLIEILAQPVFPWDGWTVWVYRAKAWFFANSLAPIVGPGLWLTATDPEVYTTPARAYPLLPSLIPLWAALAVGEWSETLVNVPVLAGAVAIALGLAGCLRSAGVGLLGTLLAAYLLFSTPLFGVHMSLGGYADIWMAGYAGLGMTSVLCGLVTGRRFPIAAGFLLLFLALFVKVEGFAWLLVAGAVVLIHTLSTRTLILLGGILALTLTLAVVTGLSLVNVPGIGPVGYANGHLFVPVKGMIRLEVFDVGGAYWRSAFLLGSWHALWALVVAALVVFALKPGSRASRAALAFFAVFIAFQAGVFVFTTEGAWAQDFTAINRMPLQMLPAILFLVVLAMARGLPELGRQLRQPGARRALLAGLFGGVALTLAGLVSWQWIEQRDVSRDRVTISGNDLRFIVGGGVLESDRILVDRYQDGIALVSSGPTSLRAGRFPILDIEIDYDTDLESLDQAPAFFWRRADQPQDVSRMTLLDSGLIDLTSLNAWYGEIVEYGFFLVDNDGAPVTITDASLSGRTPAVNLALIPNEWTHFETWGQRSAHWLPAGAYDPIVSVTGTVLTAVLLAALIAWALLGRQALTVAVFLLLGVGWVVLDMRWSWDRLRQADLSLAWIQELSIEERLADGELGVYHDYLERLRETHFGDDPQRILIVNHDRIDRYYTLRAKYQLLPHSTAVIRYPLNLRSVRRLDYVLYLGDFTGGPNARQQTAGVPWFRFRLHTPALAAHRDALELVAYDSQGALFRVRKPGR